MILESHLPPLGAHMSVAGGLSRALDRIERVRGNALQIFTRNQRQWRHRPLESKEVELFRRKREAMGLCHVFSHASYLVNLATPDERLWNKSLDNMVSEIVRCYALGIQWVVLHPGSHGGAGPELGLDRVVEGIDAIFEAAGPAVNTGIMLETTAGQGRSLGARFKELGHIISSSRFSARLTVCVDTCHIFAAGYDIRDLRGYTSTFDEFDELVGLERIRLFHLNDSKAPLGTHVDRHEHIGKGEIGLGAFSFLLNDPRFKAIPMVLETPKSKGLKADMENLRVLRGLLHRDDGML